MRLAVAALKGDAVEHASLLTGGRGNCSLYRPMQQTKSGRTASDGQFVCMKPETLAAGEQFRAKHHDAERVQQFRGASALRDMLQLPCCAEIRLLSARSRPLSAFNRVRRACDHASCRVILGDHKERPDRRSARSIVPSLEARDQPHPGMFGWMAGTPSRPSAVER